MFDIFMTKDYLVIALMSLTAFLLLSLNPVSLQNKQYDAKGNACPNAYWHALILLAVGTGLFFFFKKFTCLPTS